MMHKIKFFLKWNFWEKILRIIEVLAIIFAASVVIQIPKQIKEWQYSQEDRSFNQLMKLDEKLKEGANRGIFYAIERNLPVLKKNGGKFEAFELDYYLDDLASIEDAYYRKIVDRDSVYDWFSDYLDKTFKNKEIVNYLNQTRKEEPDYYSQIEKFAKEIIR